MSVFALRQTFALTCLVVTLAGCGDSGASRTYHPEWVIRSRLVFLSEDLHTTLDPLPGNRFRLVFPYVAGDLYGPATTGDFLHPVLNADYTFEIDLNRTHQDLMRSLEPTQFSVDYLKIEPADARIARLAPLALEPDGIEQIGSLDWVDASQNQRLLLVYVDRPSRITGALMRDGRTIKYDVRASAPGYVWIADHAVSDTDVVYTEIAKPADVLLALTPTLAQTPTR